MADLADITLLDAADQQESAHVENFSLAEFFAPTGTSLAGRVTRFSTYFRASSKAGKALYAREVIGPIDHRVVVRDPVSGACRPMLMFGSNNDLGLANHKRVKEAVKRAVDHYGIGMGGPPLLNGMSSLHRELQARLARLKHAEDALLFASGFQANGGWLTALLRHRDVLLYDEFSHASPYDWC